MGLRVEVTRAHLIDAFTAALAAVEPEEAVTRQLRLDRSGVEVAGRRLRVTGDVRVIAIGKAAAAMARGACSVLGDLVVGGVVVSDHDERVSPPLSLHVGDHPFPAGRSLTAGRAVLDLARAGGEEDLLVVLVSGGGSSLVEVPKPGLEMSDLLEAGRALMAAGTPIEDLNRVRRHLSMVKDGGVLAAATPARVLSLLISDVVDGAASVIASGPTLADGSTPSQALAILTDRLPTVPDRLVEAICQESEPATSVSEHVWQVVADGSIAASAAVSALHDMGIPAGVLATDLRGEARTEAVRRIAVARPGVSVLAGETTVSGADSGLGGRNQEAALAAAVEIAGLPGHLFAALGTDGIDGPTDAAGAIVDPRTMARGRSQGLDLESHLARHDSHPYLEATGDLVRTGATGTNVGDLWMIAKT